MRITFQLYIFNLIFLLFPLNAKGIKLINIAEEDGLSQRWVRCIYQDNYGFMWFGTKDGLNRYDGYDFKVYRPENTGNGLPAVTTNNFYAEEGNFWVCTSDGLSKYLYETDEFILFPFLKDIEVNCMLKTSTGTYWFGTQNGLFLFNPSDNSIFHFTPEANNPSSLNHLQVTGLLEDSRHNLWIGTLSGLNLFNKVDSTFIHIQDKKGRYTYDNVHVRDIIEDAYGHIWAGIFNGGVDIILEDIEDPELFEVKRVLQGNIDRIFFDNENILWVAWGNKKGVQSYNLNYFNYSDFTFKSPAIGPKWLDGYSIEAIFKDEWDDLWFGTYDRGLFYYNKRIKKFNIVNEENNAGIRISNNIVNVFYEDEAYLWIGTEGGLDRYNKETGVTRHFKYDPDNPRSLGSSSIFAITKDSRGNLWVGTWNGGLNLYNYKDQNFTRYCSDISQPGSLLSDNVFSIFEDNKSNLWIGTIREGLSVYDYDNNRFIDFTDRLLGSGTPPNASVNQIYQTTDGNLWISNYSALNLYNYTDSSFTYFAHDSNDSNSITGGDIEVIFEDSKHHLWLGTERGLNYFDRNNNRFIHYRTSDGLPSNFIMGILEDDRGNLWISTNKGISKFIHGTLLPENPEFINFDQTDGLPGMEFVKRAVLKDEQGKLYFGGINGFVYFHPDSIILNPIEPRVIITNLIIDNTIITPGDKGSVLSRAIYLTDEIRLSYKIQFFVIQYIALNYLNPYKNSFVYMLEGFDTEWHDAGSQREAIYTNIDPGHYVFKVKAANNDGIWNNKGASLKIHIRPPVWQTLIARIILILLVIGGIYAVFRLRMHRVTFQKRMLENMVKERTHELTEVNNMLETAKSEVMLQNQELIKHRYQLESLVGERTKKLENALRKAEESDRLKSSFLANMSHEIRTPMNAIVGFASLLDSENLGEELRKKYIRIINSNSESLLVLINDILEVSLIEANQIKIENKLFDIVTILSELEESCQLKNSKPVNIEFVNKNQQKAIMVYNDPIRFNQCVSNLINNALKYTSQGFIKFDYTIKVDEIITYVADSGIGIDKNESENIFQFFYKVEDEENYYAGTGLGLAITNKLTELMGGKIWFESEPGKGSTFYISLPYLPNEIPEETITAKQKKSVYNFNNINILIAEDERTNYLLIKEALKPTQASVTIFENGVKAIEYLKKNRKIKNLIVLLDIKMPKMNGYEVMEEIIKMNLKALVIAVTAYARQQDKQKILNAGFSDYLPKPIRPNELLAVIDNVINRNELR